MKKINFITILVFIALALNAQKKLFKSLQSKNLSNYTNAYASITSSVSSLYTFSTFTAPYTNITGSVVSGGLKWDEPVYNIPLGFNFKLYSQSGNTLNIDGNGAGLFNDWDNDSILSLLCPMLEDLCDRAYDPNTDNEGDAGGTSPISFTTVGTAGSRICKIEFKNVGFFGENQASFPSVSSVNFQIWLYETSNNIEFRYGAINILNQSTNLLNGSAGFRTGLIDSLSINTLLSPRSNMLNGNSGNPSMVACTSSFTEAVTPTVTNGRVYRFARVNNPTLVKETTHQNEFSLFPNPAVDKLFIKSSKPFSNEVITITGINGNVVYTSKLNEELDLKGLTKGIYFVHISRDESSVYNGKLILID